MNKPFSPPKDRAAEVSGPLPSAGADAARVGNLDDDPGMPSMDERLRRSRANMAMLAELDEILRRTNRIVERFMPMREPPSSSTRYPELNSGYEAWVRFSDYATKRGELHRSVRARIAEKVRALAVRRAA